MTDRLTIVSLDGHAQVPEYAWETYLESQYHDLLPRLRHENVIWNDTMGRLMVDRTHSDHDVFDLDGAYRNGGLNGMYELGTRLEQMDREGTAAEFLYNGEPRTVSLFFQPTSSKYDYEVVEAGVRAHHRWIDDEFGSANDRILLVGVTGHAPCHDMDATLAETRWIADHGFVGLVAPGMTGYPDMPPLYDTYWDPLWSLCEDAGLTVVVHAGYGAEAGPFQAEVAAVHAEMQKSGAPTDDLFARFSTSTMVSEFFDPMQTRKPLWQLTLGGVFDRHPKLKVLLTEIRADWLPALITHLDGIFEERRDELPTSRKPSEWWASNCMTCLSFAHRAEIEMRDEIGVDTVAFGRDYPHPEGTWPNTKAWIREAFAGVPEGELRQMLGENAIERLGLDGPALRAIGERVGPTFEELMGAPAATPGLVDHFEVRGGYLKPWEGDSRLGAAFPLIERDLATLTGS
ncbi:MAG TPA: amidohydrolase family protein [Acidimicrobiales bacterium]